MSATSLARPARTPNRRDLIGLSLITIAVAWTFVAATAGGDPWPMVGVYSLAAAGYLVGRLAPRGLIPAVVVALAFGLGLLGLARVLPEGADAAPLGYVNARAAFFVEAAAAAVMLALLSRGRVGRVVWLGTATMLALVPLFSRAHAASFVVVLLLPAAVAIALEGRRLALAVRTAAVLLMATLAGTSIVGAVPGSTAAGLVGDVIGERRVALWHDALELTRQEPIVGVGPGRFAEEAETARIDLDARWAHHGFLQQGAETGLVGLALLVLIFLWGFWQLLGAGPSGMAVMGAFALGALGLMACSDYVLHFPLITTVTAGLVGSAVAATSPSRPTDHVGRRSDATVRAEVDGSYRASPMTAEDTHSVRTGNPTGRRG